MKKHTYSALQKVVAQLLFIFFLLFSPVLYSQSVIDKFKPEETLSEDQCYDLIKTVWDGLKKISEDYSSRIVEKSEFETTREFNERKQNSKDEYVNKVNKFYLENKLDSQTYTAWFKAELVRYSADSQVYRIKSPTKILLQPKKNDIAVTTVPNKYVTIAEKNSGGYRRANLQLSTEPELFSWFVNRETAHSAKNKEGQIYFKLWFKFNVYVNESDNQVILQIVPTRLALMDQQENFTYWNEEIR